MGPAELAGCLVLLASAWKSADCGRGAGGALSWADGGKTGGVVTLLLSQQGHTHRRIHIRHTHTGNIRTTICHSLSFRRRSSFVVGNKPCLLLSSSESVRLGVQQTPLTMVTGRSSLSDCPHAIYEELLSN